MSNNEQVLKDFYAAFDEPDYISAVRPHLAPDVVWHVHGDNPTGGTINGREEVLALMREYERKSEGTLKLETSILANDHHGVAIHRATAAVGSIDYDTHEVDVFHIRDSQISEFWSFSENQQATDELWAEVK